MITAPDFEKKQIVFVFANEGEKMGLSNGNLIVKDAEGNVKIQANKTSEQNKRTKQANKTSEPNKHRKTEENYQLIRKYLKENGLSKTTDIAQAIGLSPARTRAILKEMSGLEYEGTTNNRRYRLADDN